MRIWPKLAPNFLKRAVFVYLLEDWLGVLFNVGIWPHQVLIVFNDVLLTELAAFYSGGACLVRRPNCKIVVCSCALICLLFFWPVYVQQIIMHQGGLLIVVIDNLNLSFEFFPHEPLLFGLLFRKLVENPLQLLLYSFNSCSIELLAGTL